MIVLHVFNAVQKLTVKGGSINSKKEILPQRREAAKCLASFVYIFFFAPEFIPRSLAGCLCGEKNLIIGTALKDEG